MDGRAPAPPPSPGTTAQDGQEALDLREAFAATLQNRGKCLLPGIPSLPLTAISFPGCCLRNALGDWDQKGLHSLSSYQVQGPQDEVNTFLQLLQCKYHSSVLFVCLFLIKWKTPGRAVKGKMAVVLLSRVFGTSAFSLVFST